MADKPGYQASKGHSLPVKHRGEIKSEYQKNQAREGHSLPIEHRGRDKLGHIMKLSGLGALTLCHDHMQEQIRTLK